jgi:hypothetical protein
MSDAGVQSGWPVVWFEDEAGVEIAAGIADLLVSGER